MRDIKVATAAGESALADIERLRAEFSSSGLYPILIGDAKDRERVFEMSDEGPDPSEILRYSLTIDPAEWSEKKRQLDPELYQTDEGAWPARSDNKMGIITHLDIRSRKPKKEVFIAILKLNASWEAFAHLNWGGWNDCPEPAANCAFHRDWATRYGAEVVSITGDVVQCIVAQPPGDRTASLELAREQYLYCSDIVEQGTQTIAALAAGLLGAKYWYFWWD